MEEHLRGHEYHHSIGLLLTMDVCIRVQAGKVDGRHWRQAPDVLGCLVASNFLKDISVGCSKDVEDEVQLIDIVFAFEDGFATEKLSKDAAYRPNIDCQRKQKARTMISCQLPDCVCCGGQGEEKERN